MRRKVQKTKCTKLNLTKSDDVVRLYDPIMVAYAKKLEEDPNVVSVMCNVPLEGVADDKFATDFVYRTANGETVVRECVYRKQLLRPKIMEALDISWYYWKERGVTDWGLVVDKKKEEANTDEEG